MTYKGWNTETVVNYILAKHQYKNRVKDASQGRGTQSESSPWYGFADYEGGKSQGKIQKINYIMETERR